MLTLSDKLAIVIGRKIGITKGELEYLFGKSERTIMRDFPDAEELILPYLPGISKLKKILDGIHDELIRRRSIIESNWYDAWSSGRIFQWRLDQYESVDRAITELRHELENSRTQIDALTAEREHNQARISELELQREELIATVNSQQELLTQLERRHKHDTDKKARLKDKLSTECGLLRDARDAIGRLKKNVAELEDRLDERTLCADDLRAALTLKDSEVRRASESLDLARDETADLRVRNEQLTAELTEIQAALRQEECELARVTEEYRELQEVQTAIEAVVADMEKEIWNLRVMIKLKNVDIKRCKTNRQR